MELKESRIITKTVDIFEKNVSRVFLSQELSSFLETRQVPNFEEKRMTRWKLSDQNASEQKSTQNFGFVVRCKSVSQIKLKRRRFFSLKLRQNLVLSLHNFVFSSDDRLKKLHQMSGNRWQDVQLFFSLWAKDLNLERSCLNSFSLSLLYWLRGSRDGRVH